MLTWFNVNRFLGVGFLVTACVVIAVSVIARKFRGMVKQTLAVVVFICAATLAGLAAIHYVWLNPAAIGGLALPIGMTPLVLLFEYSFEIPDYFFFCGAILAIGCWFLIRWNPPGLLVAAAVMLGGGFLVFVSVVVFVVASAYYNVGAAGEPPAGWYLWVRPGCSAGGLGLVLFTVGLLLAATRSGSTQFLRKPRKSAETGI